MLYVPLASTLQYLPHDLVLFVRCLFSPACEVKAGEYCLDHHFIALITVPPTEWVLNKYPWNEGMNKFTKHSFVFLGENVMQVRIVGGIPI